MANEIDVGFDLGYLAVALDRAKHLRDGDFPIEPSEIAALRDWAAEWAQAIRNIQARQQ